VELLVALGGGQLGGNLSFSQLHFTSFGYGWAHLMRVLLAVQMLVAFLEMGGWLLT
jgi:hypothetical protein